MFPEYQHLISVLKSRNPHFDKMVEKHTQLDQKINKILEGKEPENKTSIEVLKKEKLRLKDEIYNMLQKHKKVA